VYRWSIKVALILASAEDPPARDLFHLNPFNPQMLSPDAADISLFPIRTLGDPKKAFWVDARRFASQLLEVSIAKPSGWRSLLDGLMLLHRNQPHDALAEFIKAEASYNLHCAAAASAYRAQASFHLQDLVEAHAVLERAEGILLQLRDNEDEDLGEAWVEQRLVELAVDEARLLLELPARSFDIQDIDRRNTTTPDRE
jgi:hypothetical protein